VAHPQIAAFARLANEGDLTPQRAIAGNLTKMSRAMHDIQYDEVHDEIVIANVFAQAILTYRGAADGDEPPVRVLQGPLTGLQSSDWGVDIDKVHDELYVAEVESIMVFPRTASGDTPPTRIIRGPKTGLNARAGLRGLAVDPVNNVIVVSTKEGIVIFDRSAHGNVAPLRVITVGRNTLFKRGPSHLRVYPPKGWIVTTVDRASDRGDAGIAVWSVQDSGDVAPRWLISGPQTRLRGLRLTVALNPKAKEVMIGSGQKVGTYFLPEIF
jgi:hypothetical protein